MNMKKTIVVLTAAMAISGAFAAKKAPTAMAGADEMTTTGKGAKILVDQPPRIGKAACMMAPSLNGASNIGQCYKKPRNWIVLETKYTTFGTETSRFLDQLTFTWHVLLETKSASENKGNKEKLAPYSYFSTSMTYFNIPQGSHASSVVLPPSYLERYGEPKACGFTITTQNGDELFCGSVSEIQGIKNEDKFWDDDKIMNATGKDGKPMIERRQGLLDRSKTIWAIVFPNDYETTLQ